MPLFIHFDMLMWLFGSTNQNTASGYVRGANGQKEARIITKERKSETLSDGNDTVHMNVTHTYFLIVTVCKVDNTIQHLNQYPVDSLVCFASTTAIHWKIIYVESTFYS